jgi:nicotinamide riboside kinase
METIVVNLFGVPSSGKSTGASYVFAQLKLIGINAELITEFAKDKVWEHNEEVFANQAYIFGKQSFKQSRVKNKVDVMITDSPLLLSRFYNSDEVLGESFNKTVLNVFNSYNNMNFLLLRNKPYNPIGRQQTENESDALKQPLVDMLEECNVDYDEILGDESGYDSIVFEIIKRLERVNNSTY